MSQIDHKISPADDMRSLRQRRLIRAQMTDSFGGQYDIIIRNASDTGLGAAFQGVQPLRGSEVSVRIPPGMLMQGTIRWVDGSDFGIELENTIDVQMLTDAIQRKHQAIRHEAHWEVRRVHQVPSDHPDPTKLRRI